MCFSLISFHGLFPLEYVFIFISLIKLDEKLNFKQKISARVQQKKIKSLSKEYVM